MDSKSKYLAFAMMGAIMSYANQSPEPKPKKIKPKEEPKKVIPKGCKEYHFTNTGNQVTESCSYIQDEL